MKKFTVFAIITILFSVLIISCERDKPSGPEDETDNKKVKNIIIRNDQFILNSRITYKDQIMRVYDVEAGNLKSTLSELEVDPTRNYVFKLKAEVESPLYNDHVLQATHVTIIKDYAFVTYNTRGDVYRGGVEVFDVSDIKNPLLISQAIFPDADVSSVDYYDGKLYIVGATGSDTLGFETPAFLEVLELDADMKIAGVDTIIHLSSWAGTDVLVDEGNIYTTSGSSGELKIFSDDYAPLETKGMDHARAVTSNSKSVYAFQAEPGRLNQINKTNYNIESTFETGGANTPESKSEIAANENYLFAALNEGGMKMLNLDGTLKQWIEKPVTPEGALDENHVTNSVSLNGDLLLMANGESGLYIGGIIEEMNDTIILLGTVKFGESQSSNFVASRDSVIFVATGLGGLKILSISIDEGVPDDIIPTKPCPTLYSRISELFPEGNNNIDMHPELFSGETPLNIYTTEETDVYVTFVFEGAGYRNTFGYYTYPKDNPPATIGDLEMNILFPNVSMVNEGGGLDEGDMLKLPGSPYPANTVIGFYLVAKGWKNGLTMDGIYTHFTNLEFNINNEQQHTLFMEQNCKDIVMTFEDKTLATADKDYNDIIFTISDNASDTLAVTRLSTEGLPVK